MNLQQLATIISESIAAVGVVAAGLGYFWGQVFAGANKATTEDYNLLNTRINSLQGTCDAQQKELAGLHQEIGRLQGINQKDQSRIAELTALLQNRDPGMTEFIKFAREAISDFREGSTRTHQRLDLIDGKFNQLLSDGRIK